MARVIQKGLEIISNQINHLCYNPMKRIYYFGMTVILAIMAGCQKDEESLNIQNSLNQTFYATFENGADTRTALDGSNNVVWSEGDQISVFGGTTANNSFILQEGANSTYGTFKINTSAAGTESSTPASELSANVAYYPYESDVTVSENNGTYTFNATFPTTQTYSKSGTFGIGASPMVAVTSCTLDANLKFKNVGAIFRLQLKGNATITKIEFSAEEYLAGKVNITASNSTLPTVNVTDGSNTILLDCGEGVELSATEATNFVVALLPVEEITGGITITIYDNAGKKMVYSHKADETFTILRSKAYTTTVVEYEGTENVSSPFAGGTGTESDPYLIDRADQLSHISDYYDTYNYFKIADGVETLDLAGIGRLELNGSFDGNNVEITGLSTSLFERVGKSGLEQKIKISNLTATVNTTDGRALVRNIYNPGETTFENVTLHGYIEGQYNMGSFYNYGTANAADSEGADYTVTFINTKSDATLVCTTGNAIGGMLGHGYEGAGYTLSINMDANSGYSGKMYTTGSATCYAVMAMCSHSTYILNGVETSRYTDEYSSTRLEMATPTKTEDGYYVTPAEGVHHYIVYLNCQLTAYDDGGNKISNMAGLTWNLGKETIGSSDLENKIFDLFDSASIQNDSTDEIGYNLENGVLTVYTGRDVNFASGWLTLQVNQYDADDNILAVGNLRVHTFPEPTTES